MMKEENRTFSGDYQNLKNIENKQVQALHPSEGPKENKIQVLISSKVPGK